MKKAKKTFEMHDDFTVDETPAADFEDTAGEEGPPDLSAQMDQVVRGLSGVRPAGQVYLVDVRQLEPYPEQPFRQYPIERLQELAEDISRVGVLSPILTRRHRGRLQILSGHNRWSAAKLAGLSHVPVMILEADDDQAALILTGTNLRQREGLTPGEKAFAYKMQMDALKRQGQRDGGYDASSFITRQTGDSRMQIHRYIRLTELLPELLDMLDRGKISFTPAVAASYLSGDAQREVLRCVRDFGARLTIEKGNRLKALAEEKCGDLGRETVMELILGTEKRQRDPRYVRLRFDKIKDFLPDGLGDEEIEGFIIERLRGV